MEKNEQVMREILAEAEIYVDEICAGIRVDLDVGFKHGPITYKEFGEYHERMKLAGRKLRVLLSRVAAPEPARVAGRTGKNFREVGQTKHGYTIFVEDNEAGGHTYWSDEISGGVMIWDTALQARESIEFAFNVETPAQQTDRNAVLEEAAKICDKHYEFFHHDAVFERASLRDAAKAIRALKSTAPQQPEASELVRKLRHFSAKAAAGLDTRVLILHMQKIIDEATDMIEALSSQQPAPKNEPQRQGVENEFERHPHLAKHMQYLANCHIPGWSMLDWDDFCSAINNALTSRPATVVDDATVERAAKALDDAGYVTGMLSKDVPINARKAARVALLAALPQFNKEEKDK